MQRGWVANERKQDKTVCLPMTEIFVISYNSHEFNFLGTIIHETLEWTRHIDKVANKISRTLGILNKLKHVLPVYTLKTMYDALILPHLNYNNYIIVGF